MNKDNKPDLLDWLGMRSTPAYQVARWMGPVISLMIILLILLAITTAFMVLIQAVFFGLPDTPGAGLGTGAVAVAIIGAPFVIWRAIVAQKTVDVQEQGLITDRINKAVEGLGAEKTVNWIGQSISTSRPEINGGEAYSRTRIRRQGETIPLDDHENIVDEAEWQPFTETEPNLEVRIGAIYALERIAQDSDRDHVQIMEILCAYIRHNAPVSSLAPKDKPDKNGKIRSDVQTALTAIGRRSAKALEKERAQEYRLDLRQSDLSYASFGKGNFAGAILFGCRLEGCNFHRTNFRGV